jgi:hypothetical protein
MYCPNCATPNADDTKFCRSCGSNLSLVPQALTGQLPEASSHRLSRRESRRERRLRRDFEHGGPATLANGITKTFTGFGFLLVAFAIFAFMPSGHYWWFWLLIPAFATLGKGVAEIVSARYSTPTLNGAPQTRISPPTPVAEIPQRSEPFYPPSSVTEQTTRQLDRVIDPARYRDRDQQ